MTGRLILASRIGAALLTATPPDSAEPTDQITRELFAGGLDRADRSHAGQQPSRRCGVGQRAARDQVSEQGMELVDQPGPLGHGVVAAFVEQRQHRRQVLGGDWVGLTWHGRDACRRRCVDDVVLCVGRHVTAGEPEPSPWRGRRRPVCCGQPATDAVCIRLCGSTPITIIPRAPLSVGEWEPRTTRLLEASGSQSILC